MCYLSAQSHCDAHSSRVHIARSYFGMRVSTGQLTKHTPETVQVLLARIAALAYLGVLRCKETVMQQA
jgi:hypothetical protein